MAIFSQLNESACAVFEGVFCTMHRSNGQGLPVKTEPKHVIPAEAGIHRGPKHVIPVEAGIHSMIWLACRSRARLPITAIFQVYTLPFVYLLSQCET